MSAADVVAFEDLVKSQLLLHLVCQVQGFCFFTVSMYKIIIIRHYHVSKLMRHEVQKETGRI